MATSTSGRHRAADDTHDRAQPPLRWPRLDLIDLGLVLLWAAGLYVALFLPARIVDPTATTAAAGHVQLVYGATLVGAVAMIGATTILSRRAKDVGVLVLGFVPTAVCIIGSILITIAKINGS